MTGNRLRFSAGSLLKQGLCAAPPVWAGSQSNQSAGGASCGTTTPGYLLGGGESSSENLLGGGGSSESSGSSEGMPGEDEQTRPSPG